MVAKPSFLPQHLLQTAMDSSPDLFTPFLKGFIMALGREMAQADEEASGGNNNSALALVGSSLTPSFCLSCASWSWPNSSCCTVEIPLGLIGTMQAARHQARMLLWWPRVPTVSTKAGWEHDERKAAASTSSGRGMEHKWF